MLALFLCRIPFNPYFIYPTISIDLNTPLLAESRNPRLYLKQSYFRINIFPEWVTQCCFGAAILRLRSHISPLPYPLTSFIPVPSTLVAHKHSCPFLFSESHISLPQIQGNTCIFSRFLYSLLSYGVVYVNPSLLPTEYFWP